MVLLQIVFGENWLKQDSPSQTLLFFSSLAALAVSLLEGFYLLPLSAGVTDGTPMPIQLLQRCWNLNSDQNSCSRNFVTCTKADNIYHYFGPPRIPCVCPEASWVTSQLTWGSAPSLTLCPFFFTSHLFSFLSFGLIHFLFIFHYITSITCRFVHRRVGALRVMEPPEIVVSSCESPSMGARNQT